MNPFRGVRHRRLPVVAAFFFSCATINGTLAYFLMGERGDATKAWIRKNLGTGSSSG